MKAMTPEDRELIKKKPKLWKAIKKLRKARKIKLKDLWRIY